MTQKSNDLWTEFILLGKSMGNVPRLHEPYPNWLKLSGFIEVDELIIFV